MKTRFREINFRFSNVSTTEDYSIDRKRFLWTKATSLHWKEGKEISWFHALHPIIKNRSVPLHLFPISRYFFFFFNSYHDNSNDFSFINFLPSPFVFIFFYIPKKTRSCIVSHKYDFIISFLICHSCNFDGQIIKKEDADSNCQPFFTIQAFSSRFCSLSNIIKPTLSICFQRKQTPENRSTFSRNWILGNHLPSSSKFLAKLTKS